MLLAFFIRSQSFFCLFGESFCLIGEFFEKKHNFETTLFFFFLKFINVLDKKHNIMTANGNL